MEVASAPVDDMISDELQAMAEPPFLSRHRMQLKYWGGAIGALETLILRAGSLEVPLRQELTRTSPSCCNVS